jgi:hypothetical protein
MSIFFCGIVLTALSWISAWGNFGIFSEYSFFPLWIGYILSINGTSEILFGISLLRRMGCLFLGLFAASIPLWWFFEHINSIVQNWHYLFVRPISDLHYVIQASIDFATVIPAVLSTSFFFYMLLQAKSVHSNCQPIKIRRSHLFLSLLLGTTSFLLLPIFPHETFPLVWIAPILVLEPFAYALGLPCVLQLLELGEWKIPISIMIGTLFTGFWWELWNFYSLPKWVYTIPYVGFWKIFEMPVLGYLGYPFFGLVIFSYTATAFSVVFRENISSYFTTGRA